MFLIFWTDRPVQTVQTQIRLLLESGQAAPTPSSSLTWIYTVCSDISVQKLGIITESLERKKMSQKNSYFKLSICLF